MKDHTTDAAQGQDPGDDILPPLEEPDLRSWKLNRWVLRELDLPMAEKTVLWLFCEFANRMRNWTAWPTLATITKYTGASEGTVRRAISALEGRGLIHVTRTKTYNATSNTPRTVNHYRIDIVHFSEESVRYQPSDQGDHLASDPCDQLALDQGDRQIRVLIDPGIDDPAMSNKKASMRSDERRSLGKPLDFKIGFPEARQIPRSCSSSSASSSKRTADRLKRRRSEVSFLRRSGGIRNPCCVTRNPPSTATSICSRCGQTFSSTSQRSSSRDRRGKAWNR